MYKKEYELVLEDEFAYSGKGKKCIERIINKLGKSITSLEAEFDKKDSFNRKGLEFKLEWNADNFELDDKDSDSYEQASNLIDVFIHDEKGYNIKLTYIYSDTDPTENYALTNKLRDLMSINSRNKFTLRKLYAKTPYYNIKIMTHMNDGIYMHFKETEEKSEDEDIIRNITDIKTILESLPDPNQLKIEQFSDSKNPPKGL